MNRWIRLRVPEASPALLLALMLAVSLVSLSGCGGPSYEVVKTQKAVVDYGGASYDGIEVVTKMDKVDEEEVKYVASDLAQSDEYKNRDGYKAVLFVRTEDGNSSRSALVDFEDGSYVML